MDKIFRIECAIAIFLAVSLSLFLNWSFHGRYSVTGDEPHYLVMADGIIHYHTFEQTVPYAAEFRTRTIYHSGLGPVDAIPSSANTHAVMGPHGLFNVHNIGLPILIAIPFAVAGVLGAKIFLIVVSSLLVHAAWIVSFGLFQDRRARFFAVCSVVVSFPFIVSSNQIYSDLMGGIICLYGLAFIFSKKKRYDWSFVLLIFAISFLPWLQIKFSAASIIMSASIFLDGIRQKEKKFIISILLFFVSSSILLLLSYNYYAFGKVSGPYESGALEISWTSFMVFLGLHLDQNQGFLLQSPVMFIGVLALFGLFQRARGNFLVLLLVYASMIVPNAMHPAWYGGFSFFGRFAWSGAAIFILPTLYGLADLWKINQKAFWRLLMGCGLIQIFLIGPRFYIGDSIYKIDGDIPLFSYENLYSVIGDYLPALYSVHWAYYYPVNWGWALMVFSLLVVGIFVWGRDSIRFDLITGKVLLSCGLVIAAAATFGRRPPQEIVYQGASLPSRVGQIIGSDRVANAAVGDQSNFVTFGPYAALSHGYYKINLAYSSQLPVDADVGQLEICIIGEAECLGQASLNGTGGVQKIVSMSLISKRLRKKNYEFRVWWNGKGDLSVQKLILNKRDEVAMN